MKAAFPRYGSGELLLQSLNNLSQFFLHPSISPARVVSEMNFLVHWVREQSIRGRKVNAKERGGEEAYMVGFLTVGSRRSEGDFARDSTRWNLHFKDFETWRTKGKEANGGFLAHQYGDCNREGELGTSPG